MKKFLIGLGIFSLVLIVLLAVFGGFAFFQANKYAPAVEAFVDAYYASYNEQDTKHIFNDLSDDQFKKYTKFEDFDKFIKGTYGKLGAVESRQKGAWKIFTGQMGTVFSVQYKVKRTKADSIESFSLRNVNGSWLLYGYHVDSKDLF